MVTVTVFVGLVLAWLVVKTSDDDARAAAERPGYPVFTEVLPETGDLGVLRIICDGTVRQEIGNALAETRSIHETVRAVSKVLLAHRDAWRAAGAVDVDTCRLFEVPERYEPLLAAETERIAVLDAWEVPPDDGPFRTPGSADPRDVVVVVIVLGVRESPLLRDLQLDTLVTIGEIGRGDTVAAALGTFAGLGDRLLMGEVLVRQTHAGDLFRAYSQTELVRIKP